MLQMPPSLMDSHSPRSKPWQPGRGMGLSCGPAIISGVPGGGGVCIRPDRSSRTNVQKLTWRNSNWVRGYNERDISSMTIYDISPSVAMKRFIILHEKKQFRDAANFLNRLHASIFKLVLKELPVEVIIDDIPESLPLLEALYAKVFLSDELNIPMKMVKPETVIMHIANLFSFHNQCDPMASSLPEPLLMSCKKLIKMIVLSEPRIKKQIMARRRALEKAVDGMGHHGLVNSKEKGTLINLHEALKIEFERFIHLYKNAVQKLDELCLTPKQLVTRSLSYGPAPTKASHQRQLSLRQDEIQERLIKNKTLLNVIEPALTDSSLDDLLKKLKKRVEIDKDVVFQFTQLKKEMKKVDPDAVVAPVLMKFAKGYAKILEIVKELGDDGDDDMSSSDISGYHSDSDSAVASGSFQSRSCSRYNIMYRSVRLNSRSSNGGSSSDRSSESARSSRNKQKNGSYSKPENSVSFLSPMENLGLGSETKSISAISIPKAVSVTASSKPSSVTAYSKPSSVTTIRVPDSRSISSCCGSQRSLDGSRASSDISRTTLVCDSSSLQREVDTLKRELKAAQMTISALQDREVKLKCRLAEQAQKIFERGHRFENISLGEQRPFALIRRYGNMYAQARLDVLDELDKLLPLQHSDELKTKILFSVIVLAFKSAQNTLSDIKLNLRSLLQVRDFSMEDPTLDELDNGVTTYLRKTSNAFNLTKNVNDVCSQLYATLYDYPCLKDCRELTLYIRECVRTAWYLTNQNPPYVIDYETRIFKPELHERFHCSDPNSDAIKGYMWPVLLEGENGPCVYKGVVLT